MKTNRFRHLLLTYFTFTRAEKHAALFLTALLILLQTSLWVRSYIVTPVSPSIAAPPEIQDHRFRKDNKLEDYAQIEKPVSVPTAFFPFDPDTAGLTTLIKLGLSEKQAASFVRFREKTGGFDSVDQLSKVRVLRPELLEQWKPWLQFHPKKCTETSSEHFRSAVLQQKKLIDINHADTTLLTELPFIGGGRARAIVNYRNRLGGYVKKEQLLDLKIIPDSVFRIIEPKISCDGLVFRPLDINHTPADSLRHPYLPKPLARIIVNYREQHGPYSSLRDLEKLPLLEAEILTKLAPYLKVNP